jgi:antitoxin component YwqK of YwqJK toxin-antitoxin module
MNIFSIKLIFLIPLLMLALLIGCQHEENVPAGHLVLKKGLLYGIGNDTPYTGTERGVVNGQKIEYQVVNGKKNGFFRTYYGNGKPAMEGNIVNNLNEGTWKYYYDNGQIESEGNFKNDTVDGNWKWYYLTGAVKEEGDFVNGKREGVWKTFDVKGDAKEIIYENGEVVSDSK